MLMKLFVLLQKLTDLIWDLLAKFTGYPGSLLSKRWAERVQFEQLNFSDEGSRSFAMTGQKASWAMAISSEGELEQIGVIVHYLLKNHHLIELVYTSNSVEKKIQKLYSEYPTQVRFFRFPFIVRKISILKWVTASRLVLCRYDFFPPFLIFKTINSNQLFLVSATLKNRRHLLDRVWSVQKLYNQLLYKWMDRIITATMQDKRDLINLGVDESHIDVFEFRVLQILERKKRAPTIAQESLHLAYLSKLIQKYQHTKTLIVGSYWPNERNIFSDKDFLSAILSRDILVVLAPHKLNQDFIVEVTGSLEQVFKEHHLAVPIYHLTRTQRNQDLIDHESMFDKAPGIIISSLPGVLCECYSFFGVAYVGGGHGRSIHSVLEPFVCDARVFCGPKIHRSTEYDLCCEIAADEITVISDMTEFFSIWKKSWMHPVNKERRDIYLKRIQNQGMTSFQKLEKI